MISPHSSIAFPWYGLAIFGVVWTHTPPFVIGHVITKKPGWPPHEFHDLGADVSEGLARVVESRGGGEALGCIVQSLVFAQFLLHGLGEVGRAVFRRGEVVPCETSTGHLVVIERLGVFCLRRERRQAAQEQDHGGKHAGERKMPKGRNSGRV